jgi:hypothetical protein
MRTRNAEIQRVAVANVVSDRQAADAGRWTKASATAIPLLIPTAGSRPPLLILCRIAAAQCVIPAARAFGSPYHGGLTPAAPDSAVVLHQTSVGVHCKRGPLPNHGGLTPAAPANVGSCIAKIVIISADGRRSRNKSGGRKPPWFATATAPAFASTPPAVPGDFAEAFLQVRFPDTHGGLTPAALVPASRGRCTVRDFCATAFGSPYHGGLTPAALVNVRSCIAKIVFSPANVRTAK